MIDRAQLRGQLRHLDFQGLLALMERTVDLCDEDSLLRILEGSIHPQSVAPDAPPPPGLLDSVREFRRAYLDGDYHENIRHRDYASGMDLRGTASWANDFYRHLNACVEGTEAGEPAEAREAFEILFGILRTVFEGEYVTWIDDEGPWILHIEWKRVLPAWFRCLAEGSNPDQYATTVRAWIYEHGMGEGPGFPPRAMNAATAVATAAQRAALEA